MTDLAAVQYLVCATLPVVIVAIIRVPYWRQLPAPIALHVAGTAGGCAFAAFLLANTDAAAGFGTTALVAAIVWLLQRHARRRLGGAA